MLASYWLFVTGVSRLMLGLRFLGRGPGLQRQTKYMRLLAFSVQVAYLSFWFWIGLAWLVTRAWIDN